MADVKFIYVVGTFPDTSWGLSKISAISLRETVVARLEMRVFIFTTLVSIFHKPPHAARGRHSKSCSATNVLHCFSPSAPCCTMQKVILAFIHRLWALCSNANLFLCLYNTCNRLGYVFPKSSALGQLGWYFQGKAFLLLKKMVLLLIEINSKPTFN